MALRHRGFRWLLVPEDLHPRLLAITKSLELHRDQDGLTGRDSHFAMSAALAAAPFLGKSKVGRALHTHRAANRARHAWHSPSTGSTRPLSASTASPTPALSGMPPAEDVLEDPLMAPEHDPSVEGLEAPYLTVPLIDASAVSKFAAACCSTPPSSGPSSTSSTVSPLAHGNRISGSSWMLALAPRLLRCRLPHRRRHMCRR